MKKSFNDGWKFYKGGLDETVGSAFLCEDRFKDVSIPHDWLIYDTNNLYEDSVGFYYKDFEKPEIPEDGHVFVYFEGVYMDSCIYINGTQAGEWKYGYSSFYFDITGYIKDGINRIIVTARYQSPNTRWYSGAGIYRNVWLYIKPESYCQIDGTYFHTEKKNEGYEITVQSDICNAANDIECKLSICERESGKAVFVSEMIPGEEGMYTITKTVKDIKEWDICNPNLYRVTVDVMKNGKTVDSDEFVTGFKNVEITTDSGLWLNGRHVKINGTCEHHDLGVFGAAINREALKRRLVMLKEAGVNSIRTSHNMPSIELLDLCDEMGFMVMDESFDMWEYPKTTYDYARFFKEWSARDVESWIKRDRNRVCLIMWSIGNEIGDTHASERGQEITRYLINEVRKHDPLENAPCTTGSNYMAWENAKKCADIMKLVGYNYAERLYDEHHSLHKDWKIFGSETASVVMSRGVYRFPLSQSVMSEVDEQCSALGNSTTSWGAKSIESCITAERDHIFSLGQYLWTGFDYIGEPTPYSTKNSYFGFCDTAGFPKDAYYVYGCEWNLSDYKEKPRIHIFPYWDWNEGEIIDVRVTTNAPAVELFLNDISYGKKDIDHAHGDILVPSWKLNYTKGKLKAVAYDYDGSVLITEEISSFKDSVKPVLYVENCNEAIYEGESVLIPQDGRSLYFIDISTVDEDGNTVSNAMDYVYVTVSENAELVGMDNGDSTDYDLYQSSHRKLFNGRLGAVIKAVSEGCIKVTVKRDEFNKPVRKTELFVPNGQMNEKGRYFLTPLQDEIIIKAKIYPEGAECDIRFACVNDKGIEVNFAHADDNGAVKAIGDGEFTLRAYAYVNGKVKIISQLEFEACGFGNTLTDPYEFVSAGLFSKSQGEIGNGNDKGIATSYTMRSGVGFENIDFGDYGSDEITLWVFTLTGDLYNIEMYDGEPDCGGKLIMTMPYCKKSIWNVYQEETYKLPEKLKGVHEIWFMLNGQKAHIKGFVFRKYDKAFEKLDCSYMKSVTGDSFKKTEKSVLDIGNNVTITFDDIDLHEEGAGKIEIFGSTVLDKCSVHLLFTRSDNVTERRILEYKGGKTSQEFAIERLTGKGRLEFVFLPGSKFDFEGFRFTV